MRTPVLFADATLWATGFVRTQLAGRSEPYAAGVQVGIVKPPSGRAVVLNRDGGPAEQLRDFVRLRVRVWADSYQDAADLARLVRTLLLASPGEGPVVAASSSSGPSDVPDSPQYQFLLYVDLTLRGTNLA